MVKRQSPELTSDGKSAAGSLDEVQGRINSVISLYDTRISAAQAAGISTDQLGRQARGLNRPTFEAVRGLAHPKGVSLDWIATGEGEMYLRDRTAVSPPPDAIDEILLGNLVEGLEEYLAAKDLMLAPRPKARVMVVFARILARYRQQLVQTGGEVPAHLRAGGNPVNIAQDPILAEIVSIVQD